MTTELLSDRITSLDGRVTRMEGSIDAGFQRIENLLRSEITELKTEQIRDLREEIRSLNTRCFELERYNSQRLGGIRLINNVMHFSSAAVGALVGAVAAWIAKGHGSS